MLSLQFSPSGQQLAAMGNCFGGTGFYDPGLANTLSLLRGQSNEGLNASMHPANGCGVSLRVQAIPMPNHPTIVSSLTQQLLDQQQQVNEMRAARAAEKAAADATERHLQRARSTNGAGL